MKSTLFLTNGYTLGLDEELLMKANSRLAGWLHVLGGNKTSEKQDTDLGRYISYLADAVNMFRCVATLKRKGSCPKSHQYYLNNDVYRRDTFSENPLTVASWPTGQQ